MSYQCLVCKKVSSTPLDLARHIIGRGDKVHKEWLQSKGFKYSELLTLQFKDFGGGGYRTLAALLEKEAKVEDKPPAV